ncbi:UpxY family transcription antiterminator [Gillisia limnaea]|uniref:NusG antitermination factor n=1 Tax=Gillisia limnaea (strain DSM 15749 / LMG 21470 / R-8282) TaxID=865937 RepID=H2C017_GILLR|nr:UpxY family transcription antiterminator [Gillisia limnaea]EHQ02384.1 NusG antitermination factor [Gillisia limnaea DSM 15749]
MQWYVIYTKPRWEKRVCREIEELEIEAYCPVITEVRQWSDRKKKVETPLFKSYVFVRLPAASRDKVFQVHGVIRFLYWLGKPAVVRDAEIETLKHWLDNGRVEEIETGHLTPGDQITIATGNFKGQEAVIKEIGNKRLRLVLSSMGFVVNVKLSEALEG